MAMIDRKLTAAELMDGYGVPVGPERCCGRCGLATLYAIKWPDGTTVLLCVRCDRPPDS